MSTRSLIGIVNDDDSVNTIYCHYVYIFDHRKWLFADLYQKGHTTWQDLAKHLGY